MKAQARRSCPNCRRLQTLPDAQEARLKALEATVARLQGQLAAARKDSSTSSKPPSSDLVKPPKPEPPAGPDRRRIGGQPGHPQHERATLPSASIDGESVDSRLDLCPCCGHDLQPMPTIEPRVIQQVDISDVPLVIQEHRGHPGWCSHCRKQFEARLPIGIERGGLVGPRLTTVIAYLKRVCRASYPTVREFLRDVVGVTISRGQLANIIAKVSEAPERPYEELLTSLPDEKRLNVDETGHKRNRLRPWIWSFRADLDTSFQIDPTRSGDVLIEVPGKEFNGVLGCDSFSADRRYLREFGATLQFGLAHLIRDVKFLTTLPDAREQRYGTRPREALRALFGVIHRREQLAPEQFQSRLEAARAEVLRRARSDVPATNRGRNLAKRFEAHGASYFRLITTPGVEPTNDLAEQAIRFVVIDRRITQGTRSETGNRWCERIWAVIATWTQRGRSVFEDLEAAVGAWFADSEPPRLLPGI
jgi:transposase